MKQIQFKVYQYLFKPSLVGIIATLICVPLFINFGLWQYNKAQQKLSIQSAYNQAKVGDALLFPAEIISNNVVELEDWKYKKVSVVGTYETKYQFLLDNQVDGQRVGYHVITPLKIDGSTQYVLVNRGWILGKDTHTDLPEFSTPTGKITLTGQIWVPSKKFFSLEGKANPANKNEVWQAVWQNMDMAKYQKSVPFSVSAMAIKLDGDVDAGGFVRNWQVPVERIATNIGYAYQWFGFALASLFIFIYMSFTRIKQESEAI